MKNSIIKKMLKRDILKDKNIRVSMLIIIISTLLVVISFSFKKSMDYYIDNGIKKDISYRTLFVDQNMDEDLDLTIRNIQKIQNVANVTIDNYHHFSFEMNNLDTDNINGSFFIMSGTSKTIPIVSVGKIFSGEYEIVCPKIFYPSDDITSENIKNTDLIDMNKYINKYVKGGYYKFIDEDNAEFINVKLKIVGLYDNNPSYIDENICYTSNNVIKKMFDDSYENIDFSNQLDSIIVQTDDYNNNDNVINELEKLGYYSSMSVSLNEEFIYSVNFICYFILAFSMFFSIIVVLYMSKKTLIERKQEINLYRSIGFSKSKICRYIYLLNIIMCITSIIISTIIIFLIVATLNYIVKINPIIFQKIPVMLSVPSIILSIIIAFLTLIISTKNSERIIFNNIIENMRN